jgi:hypothetical protein
LLFGENHCLLLAVQLAIMHKKIQGDPHKNKRFQRLVNGNGAFAKHRRAKLIVDILKDMQRKSQMNIAYQFLVREDE